ncbi:MAG TPA: zf-HC2 domain-containing protein [Gammaproteobacteria bacterium]
MIDRHHDDAGLDEIVQRYVFGRLSADESERFEAHYLDCAECQDRLETFEAMRAGLTALGGENVHHLPLPPRPVSRAPAMAMAAILAGLVALPLGMMLESPSRGPGPASVAGVPVLPVSQLRGSGDEPQAVITPPTGSPFVLMLELAWPEHAAYTVRIHAADGGVLWTGEGLQPNYLDSLAVSIPPGFLAPGIYRAEVLAETAAGDAFIGAFPFRVHAASR